MGGGGDVKVRGLTIQFKDAHVVGDNDDDDDDEDGSVDCYDDVDVDDNLPAPGAPVGGPQGSPSLF